MLRTVWFLIALVGFTGWYGMKAIIAGILRIPNRPGGVYDECARRWGKGMLRAVGIRLKVAGLERVPRGVPVVYASNHQSWFDIFALLAAIPGQMRFVAKQELASVPVLGGAMRAAGHIYIDRKNRQQAFSAYDDASAAIRNGLSAVVFPEGTRSRTGDLIPFKKGPFVLAIAAGVPIIPTYCAGTFNLLPRGTVRLRPHPIAVLFGDPIPTAGLQYDDREGLMEQCRLAIQQLREQSRDVLA